MTGGSKKGFPYERSIARKLSLWVTEGERDDILWRTEGSGGRATNRHKQGKKLPFSYGDITVKDPTDERGIKFISNVLIEVKRGYSKASENDPLDLIDKKQGIPLIVQWWRKSQKEANQSSRNHVWIIFQRDRKENCIIVDNIDTEFFNSDCMIVNLSNKYPDMPTLCVMKLNNFLDYFLPAKYFKDRYVTVNVEIPPERTLRKEGLLL